MNNRVHITDDNHDQVEAAVRPRPPEPGGYVSPAYLRWAEQVERDARPLAETFTLPTTTAELDGMTYADRLRVYTEDRALYDRLTGHTAA
ncbi:hypothetical protein ACFQ7B_38080 [Streptomyces erythrochromogenes]|uniref:hypothetical protein n=1 Tax=Streptomyces erythrochromogenes TaxID=285574 RepID=UPI0036CB65B9